MEPGTTVKYFPYTDSNEIQTVKVKPRSVQRKCLHEFCEVTSAARKEGGWHYICSKCGLRNRL